jgi:hypothetical protein
VILPSGQWPLYTDSEYPFTAAYPTGFIFEKQSGNPGIGLLMSYRTLDPADTKGYPRGQIEIVIYTNDADTLAKWIAKHTGQPTSSDRARYWNSVSNQTSIRVGGREGLAFDWMANIAVHAAAIQLGTAYVLLIQWWSTDSTYAATMYAYYQQMLNQLRV